MTFKQSKGTGQRRKKWRNTTNLGNEQQFTPEDGLIKAHNAISLQAHNE